MVELEVTLKAMPAPEAMPRFKDSIKGAKPKTTPRVPFGPATCFHSQVSFLQPSDVLESDRV